MKFNSILALALLGALWACPAFAEITPEAQALMDNHRCADGSSLSEVLAAGQHLGFKLLGAQIISLDSGQKALQVEYRPVFYYENLVFGLLWLLDSGGRQLQAPLSSPEMRSPSPGYLSAEIADLGKACWLHNINGYYEDQNEDVRNHAGIGADDPEDGEFTPYPVDPRISRDLSVLAVIPVQGFADGLAGLAKQAGLRLDFADIFTVPPSARTFDWKSKSSISLDEKGLYINACLVRIVPGADRHAGDVEKFGPHTPFALWRRAPGSQTFEPMDDIARQLSAGIVPAEIK